MIEIKNRFTGTVLFLSEGMANLNGATLPDRRKWQQWLVDPLDGLCSEPEVRAKAISAWDHHKWINCPMHAAYGWNTLYDVPEDKQIHVAAFVALFDAKLLTAPQEKT